MKKAGSHPSSPADELVVYGRRLLSDRLTTGTGGNLSRARRKENRMFLTPSGIPYEQLSAAAISVIDMDGRHLAGEKPSSEWQLHREIYRARPEVNAVVHTHSPFATTFAVLNRPIPACHYLVGVCGGNQVRVAPFATFGSMELARLTVTALGSENCILLANHGLVAVGETLARAYSTALYIEEVAELYWRALAVGEPVILSSEEMEKSRKQLGIYTGQPDTNPPST